MCLIVFAWRAHPRYPLILAANRDERHDRPARAAHWWPDAPAVFGGRDAQAGGAWCAADTNGRFAAVTNVHDRLPPAARRSRGALVYDYLAADAPAPAYCNDVAPRRTDFGAFNLLVGDRDGLFFLSNRGATQRLELGPGVYALSNGYWGARWPKTESAQSKLRALIGADRLDCDALFGLLTGDRAGDDARQSPRRSIFIRGSVYGTRAATLLYRDRHGRTTFRERGFDRSGQAQHAARAYWMVADRPDSQALAP